ncbi:MAG TPA: hypothetical protein VLZ03_03380 [Thermodesulfobacteriota bacterium]|nr:hypothetical protein [Thermodesulfobacteriota bacterium]
MEKLCNSCLYIMTTELDNPGLWSNEMVEKAVKREGGVPCDIESARLIIKNYLGVLRDTLRAA